MTKHTRGPWRYGISKASMFIYDQFGNIVASIKRSIVADARKESDARLIAAAPDLLEALQALMTERTGGKKECGHEFDCVCASEKARAAIAKATGGAA